MRSPNNTYGPPIACCKGPAGKYFGRVRRARLKKFFLITSGRLYLLAACKEIRREGTREKGMVTIQVSLERSEGNHGKGSA